MERKLPQTLCLIIIFRVYHQFVNKPNQDSALDTPRHQIRIQTTPFPQSSPTQQGTFHVPHSLSYPFVNGKSQVNSKNCSKKKKKIKNEK